MHVEKSHPFLYFSYIFQDFPGLSQEPDTSSYYTFVSTVTRCMSTTGGNSKSTAQISIFVMIIESFPALNGNP